MTKAFHSKSLVLYADDDSDDIELIQDAFREYAHNVELMVFRNGLELLNYLKEIRPYQPNPCLIILDINMPVLDGKDTLKRIREMDGGDALPVVLFSTSTLPSEAMLAKRLDAGFVTKPLHAAQIDSIVDQLIDNCTDDVKKRILKRR